MTTAPTAATVHHGLPVAPGLLCCQVQGSAVFLSASMGREGETREAFEETANALRTLGGYLEALRELMRDHPAYVGPHLSWFAASVRNEETRIRWELRHDDRSEGDI